MAYPPHPPTDTHKIVETNRALEKIKLKMLRIFKKLIYSTKLPKHP